MFREMRRFKQQLPDEEALEVLKEGHLGVLSVLGEDDYPYGLPIDYYLDEDGHVYFHGAKEGHKVDAIARHDKVSLCVMDEDTPDEVCFEKIERVVKVYEAIGADGGARHDF